MVQLTIITRKYLICMQKGSINRDTAKHVYSEVWIQHDTIAVVYYVPDYEEFSLYRVDFLPVLVGNGKACVRIDSKPYLAAISMDGQFAGIIVLQMQHQWFAQWKE
jgi:hypothetical protein